MWPILFLYQLQIYSLGGSWQKSPMSTIWMPPNGFSFWRTVFSWPCKSLIYVSVWACVYTCVHYMYVYAKCSNVCVCPHVYHVCVSVWAYMDVCVSVYVYVYVRCELSEWVSEWVCERERGRERERESKRERERENESEREREIYCNCIEGVWKYENESSAACRRQNKAGTFWGLKVWIQIKHCQAPKQTLGVWKCGYELCCCPNPWVVPSPPTKPSTLVTSQNQAHSFSKPSTLVTSPPTKPSTQLLPAACTRKPQANSL